MCFLLRETNFRDVPKTGLNQLWRTTVMHSSPSGRTRLLQLALSLIVLLIATSTYAQTSTRLSGTVVDGQGKGVGNAIVTVRGGTSKTTRADANG